MSTDRDLANTVIREPKPLPAELEAYLYGEEPTALIQPVNMTAPMPTPAPPAPVAQTEEMLVPPLTQEYQVQEDRKFSVLAIVSLGVFLVLGFLATPLAVIAMWRIYTRKQRGMWLAALVVLLGFVTFATFLVLNSSGMQVVYVEKSQ